MTQLVEEFSRDAKSFININDAFKNFSNLISPDLSNLKSANFAYFIILMDYFAWKLGNINLCAYKEERLKIISFTIEYIIDKHI